MDRFSSRTALLIFCFIIIFAVSSLPSQCLAFSPKFGVGAGLGEVGTFGVSARIRPTDLIGIEPGLGAYYYYIDDNRGPKISGMVPAEGVELVFYFTDMTARRQHGIGIVGQYNEVIGPIVGVSYRYEFSFGQRRSGMHFDFGLAYAPDAEDKVEEFYKEETNYPLRMDLDYGWIPLLLKVGFQF